MEFSGTVRKKIEQARLEKERRAHESTEARRCGIERRRQEAKREAGQTREDEKTQDWIASLRLVPDETGWISVADHFFYQQYLRGAKPGELAEIPSEGHDGPGVYFLRIETGLVKIGRSAHPEERLLTLQRLIPIDTEVVHIIRSQNDIALEAHFHQRFAAQRVHGEWFQLSDDDIRAIKAAKHP